MQHPQHYGVIVVGGGHAGTEAALASARMGVRSLAQHGLTTVQSGQVSLAGGRTVFADTDKAVAGGAWPR